MYIYDRATKIIPCAFALSSLLVGVSAVAEPILPPPSSTYLIEGGSSEGVKKVNGTDGGRHSLTLVSARGSTLSSLTPDPTVYAGIGADDGATGDAKSIVMYHIELVGPATATGNLVAIDLHENAEATAVTGVKHGSAGAEALLQVQQDDTKQILMLNEADAGVGDGNPDCVNSLGYCRQTSDVDYTFNFNVPLNTPLTVEMDALAYAGDYANGGGAAAYIDPLITLDSSVADPSLYSFMFSPGVGNAPGTALNLSTDPLAGLSIFGGDTGPSDNGGNPGSGSTDVPEPPSLALVSMTIVLAAFLNRARCRLR